MREETIIVQKELCERFGADYLAVHDKQRLGIAYNVKEVGYPLNGLRLNPENGTCGWFVWAGETLSTDPDFFLPLHINHIEEWCPQILPYLGLSAGWRFLIAPDYEDVWFDASLLATQ